MSIGFILELRKDDWRENVKGWGCPVLTIPGATLEALYASGEVNSTWYQVDTRFGMIKWLHQGRPPESATAQIALTKELEDREVSSLWKKLAIILPAVVSIIVAFITAYLAHSSTPHQNCSLWTVKGEVALGDLSRHQVVTTIKPPDTDINDDGSFRFTLPTETRSGGGGGDSPPTIIFSPLVGGYKTAVVHPEKNSERNGYNIRITTPIAIEKAPGAAAPEKNRS